jgi:hypothetical protein
MSSPPCGNEAECSEPGVGVRPGEKAISLPEGPTRASLYELGAVGGLDEVPSPWASMTERADGPPACFEGDSDWLASVGIALAEAGWSPVGTVDGLDEDGPEKEAGWCSERDKDEAWDGSCWSVGFPASSANRAAELRIEDEVAENDAGENVCAVLENLEEDRDRGVSTRAKGANTTVDDDLEAGDQPATSPTGPGAR